MADKAIGSLVEATVINDADRFVLEQSGQAKQISGATMISEFAEALDGHGGIQSIDLVGSEGNAKTYRITYTDGTTYDYVVRDGESGNYAVVAGNLAPYSDASGATQSIPFLSQGTGRGNGSATVSAGNYCQLKKKLGNTVGVNQPIRNGNFADSSYWSPYDSSAIDLEIANGIGKVTFKTATGSYYRSMKQAFSPVIGHKYLLKLSIRVSAPGGYAIDIAGSAQGKQYTVSTANVWTDIYKIIDTAGGSASSNILFEPLTGVGGVGDTMEYRNIAFPDLTLWFGSNDLIPSDLLSHPENWGRYYAGSLDYAAGYLDSADGTVLKSIGRNMFDRSKETVGKKFNASGQLENNSTFSVSDYIEVSPNTDIYYLNVARAAVTYAYAEFDAQKNFIKVVMISGGSGNTTSGNKTTSSNCHFVRICYESAQTAVCVSLYYPGESGYDQYCPYSVLAEVDTGSEVLRSAGAVADEKTPDGTITRNVGYVDLGTLNWSYISAYGCFYVPVAPTPTPKNNFVCICSKYSYGGAYSNLNDKQVGFIYNNTIAIKDSTYGTDAAAFQTAMSGVYLYYELATPTTEQGTAFAENIPCDPVGSMSWENTHGIPQGAEIFYPFDYAGTLDSMLKALPSANGTYTFKATVANGKITYSWVAD